MKISFDFDDTLEHREMQDMARKYIEAGHEVWITSSRSTGRSVEDTVASNRELFDVACDLGIRNHIQLTNGAFKLEYLNGFDMHFDDNKTEVDLINASSTGCIGLLYKHKTILKRLI